MTRTRSSGWISSRFEDGLVLRLFDTVACSCCVRSIRVRQLLSLGVRHPEDFLNVVGHVLKPLFAFLKQRLSSRAFGNVAHDKEVPVRKVVPGRSEIDDQPRSFCRNQTCASWFLLGAE